MVTYSTFSQRFRGDAGEYVGWGIAGHTEEGRVAVVAEDVTEERDFALALAEALNRYSVEPVHVPDVVLDFLSDPEEKSALLEHRLGV